MQTVVLNADYTYLNTVSWKRGIKLIVKEKVEVLKTSERQVSNYEKTYIIRIPLVLKLVKMVKTVYRNRMPYSRRNVYIRDDYTCQYCGNKPKKLSIDHVTPVSKGGKTRFTNCVTCCIKCNTKKGNRTPEEANMMLKKVPYVPTIMDFLEHKMRNTGVFKFLKDYGVY